jgi:hypothetical protein
MRYNGLIADDRQLETVLSYWEQQSFFGPVDIAIIGAGLVGLTAAIYLKERRPNWRIVVLERGALPSGASTKNAGFACFGSILELIKQEQRGDTQTVVAAETLISKAKIPPRPASLTACNSTSTTCCTKSCPASARVLTTAGAV